MQLSTFEPHWSSEYAILLASNVGTFPTGTDTKFDFGTHTASWTVGPDLNWRNQSKDPNYSKYIAKGLEFMKRGCEFDSYVSGPDDEYNRYYQKSYLDSEKVLQANRTVAVLSSSQL